MEQTEQTQIHQRPHLAATLSQRGLALSLEGRAGAASSDHPEPRPFLWPLRGPIVRSQPIFKYDVVVDRLSRNFDPCRGHERPLLLDG